jgi:type II secretory pathway pseudopilin PulG
VKRRPFEGELGFTLVETVVAAALTSVTAFTLVAAVLGALHATARSSREANLTDHALNILSDLREATAYDANALNKIEGQTVSSTFPDDAASTPSRLTASVTVTRDSASNTVFASVTVGDSGGATATEKQVLFVEAPAPGSVIDQETPSPGSGG